MRNSCPNPKLSPVALSRRAHDDVEVVLWCRAGRAELAVDGRPVVLDAGDAIWMATGVDHAALTEHDTVIVPIFLQPSARPALVVERRWSVLRGIPDAVAAVLTTADVDCWSLIQVSDDERAALHDRVRAAFAHPFAAITTPLPRAATPWIDDESRHMLLWCVRGRGTVSIATDAGIVHHAVRRDQALAVPAGVPHRVRTERGGALVPLVLDQHHGAFPRLLHVPARRRTEAVFDDVALRSDLRPERWDGGRTPLDAAPTDVALDARPMGSPERRVQRIQRTLHDRPGHLATLEDWGARLGVTPRSIELAFAAHADRTFADWRQELRMHRAASWLDEGRQAKWVSHHLGYGHVSAFSRAFRRHAGRSVRDHQAEARENVLRLR